jgi:hypothetical protein
MLKVKLAMLAIAGLCGMLLVKRYGMAGAAFVSLLVGFLSSLALSCLQIRYCGKGIYRSIFFFDAALLAGFVIVSLTIGPLLFQSGLLVRIGLFIMTMTGFGIFAFVFRKSFVPPTGSR